MRNINELIGLIKGISFDGVVNEKETEKLKHWVDRSRNLAYKAGDIEFIGIIDNILEDHIVTDQEREILLEYCDRYITSDSRFPEIYLLQGMLEGVVSDDVVNSQEIDKLQEWIDENDGKISDFPECEAMVEGVRKIISDGKVTEDEREKLLDIINNQIEEVQFESKIAYLRKQVKSHKNIGIDLIEILGKDDVIERIHSLAENELKKLLVSYYGLTPVNREIIFISLTIIAMLHYEEGRYYESVRETYSSLYNSFSDQKIEGHIRSVLGRFRTDKNSNERQVNVALKNAIVPGYYLQSFFDFIYDIYKLNFQYDLPDDMYEDFRFVYEGLRQAMLSDGDDIRDDITKKTYKLIRTTKQLIVDEKSVDSVIKLSIIIVRLIDKRVWNKELKVYNPYLKQGFDGWSESLRVSAREMEGRRNYSAFRSRWEPKFILLDNHVYLVPPIHRIKADYDYSTVRIVVCNEDEELYSNETPDIRGIIGGYEINEEKIRIDNPLGHLTYKLYAGNDVIYDSKESLYRGILAFSYDNGSEVKNNSDFNGTAIFCYRGSSDVITPYHQTEHYSVAQYGAHLGDTVILDGEFFYFSSLVRPGIFGDELENCCLYDLDLNKRINVFKNAENLVFETTNLEAVIEINIDNKAYRATDLECETSTREGVIRYVVSVPELSKGFHCIAVYELNQGRRTELAKFEFAIESKLLIEVLDEEDGNYSVKVKSDLIDGNIVKTVSATTYNAQWLTIDVGGRNLSYVCPLPFTFYSVGQNDDDWRNPEEDIWIDEVKSNTALRITDKKIIEAHVYGSDGRLVDEPIVFQDKGTYKEAQIGYLKSLSSNYSYFSFELYSDTNKEATIRWYNKCLISDDTSIEYNETSKCLDVETWYYGKGNIYFTVSDQNKEIVYKSKSIVNGEHSSIDGLKAFEAYKIVYYEKSKGLSLTGDKVIETRDIITFDWSNLHGKAYRISEAYYDHFYNGKLIRKEYTFYNTFLHINKMLDEGLYEGELYTKKNGIIRQLDVINPVEVELCGEADKGMIEISITKEGDGLLLDIYKHTAMNSLDDPNACDIFSYNMNLKGIEQV